MGVVASSFRKTRLNLYVETAVNEDLSPEIASSVMMGLTLIYYHAFTSSFSHSLTLSRAYFKLLHRTSFHIRTNIFRFPRHHLVDSLILFSSR